MDKVEQIARAMCVADGNDPNAMCYRIPEHHLSGFASSAKLQVDERWLNPAWHLYVPLAQTAIEEIEKITKEGDPRTKLDTQPYIPAAEFRKRTGISL